MLAECLPRALKTLVHSLTPYTLGLLVRGIQNLGVQGQPLLQRESDANLSYVRTCRKTGRQADKHTKTRANPSLTICPAETWERGQMRREETTSKWACLTPQDSEAVSPRPHTLLLDLEVAARVGVGKTRESDRLSDTLLPVAGLLEAPQLPSWRKKDSSQQFTPGHLTVHRRQKRVQCP